MHEERAVRLLQGVQVLKKLLSEEQEGGAGEGNGQCHASSWELSGFLSLLVWDVPVDDVIGLLRANDT